MPVSNNKTQQGGAYEHQHNTTGKCWWTIIEHNKEMLMSNNKAQQRDINKRW